MKSKFKEKLEELEKKAVSVLDKNKDGIVEPQEVIETLSEVVTGILQLKQLFKSL